MSSMLKSGLHFCASLSFLFAAAAFSAGTASAEAVLQKPAKAAPQVAPQASPGTPTSSCRSGFTQQGYRLCMTGYRGHAQYDNAVIYCQDAGGRVADVNDWRYRIYRGDGVSAPVGWWFGPRTGDDRALYANSSNVGNADGEANTLDNRGYACAHDLIR